MQNKIYPLLNTEFNQLNLCILENGMFHGDRRWVFNDVVSSFNRMYFIISGQAYLEDSSSRHQLSPGKIYLIPAGKAYNYVCTSEISKFYLHFSLEFLPGADVFQGLERYLCMDYEPELLAQLLHFAEENTLSGMLQCKSIFTKIAAEFMVLADEFEDYHLNYSRFYKQKDVLQFIAAHLDANLRIAQIAEFFSVPAYALSRSFKQDTGTVLKAHIAKMLLNQSKHLLLNTDLTIQEISNKFSFCDAYYFSRFFSKNEHLTPTEYRKKHMLDR